MSTCQFFPKYCTSVRHNIEETCIANMRSYYGRARSYGCPTCFEVVDTSFEDFLALHKSHLGQYRDATKLEIMRKIVPMPQIKLAPSLTIVPPLIISPQNVPNVSVPKVYPQGDFPSTSSNIPPFHLIPPTPFGTDMDDYETTTANNNNKQQTTTTNQQQQQHPINNNIKRQTTTNHQQQTAKNNIKKQQHERSPSFNSASPDRQIGLLKDGLSLLNENFVKSVRRSRKEMSELIKYLTEEKGNLQVRLEEMQKQIASLSEENMELKELMLSSDKEKEEKKNRRRKEKDEEKNKRRKEKEEEKKKRRKEKDEEAMDRDVEREFKESQMEKKTKQIVMEAIEEWNTQQGERKRQQRLDEEESRIHSEKKKKRRE